MLSIWISGSGSGSGEFSVIVVVGVFTTNVFTFSLLASVVIVSISTLVSSAVKLLDVALFTLFVNFSEKLFNTIFESYAVSITLLASSIEFTITT